MEWLLVWLIVNALFVVWRALVVSSEMELAIDQSAEKALGNLLSQQAYGVGYGNKSPYRSLRRNGP